MVSEGAKRRSRTTNGTSLALLVGIAVAFAGSSFAAEYFVNHVNDPGVITTGQKITPAGKMLIADGRVYGLAFQGDDLYAAVGNYDGGNVVRFKSDLSGVSAVTHMESAPIAAAVQDVAPNGEPPSKGFPGMDSLAADLGGPEPFVAARVSAGTTRKVRLLRAGARATVVGGDLGGDNVGHPAIAARADAQGRRLAVVPLAAEDAIAVVDVASNHLISKIKTGIAPYSAAISDDGERAYVTNWGGRVPLSGDRTAKTGISATSDSVIVDERGIAVAGTVSAIDLRSGTVVAQIVAGRLPSALAWDQARGRLFITNSNDDTISVIDTRLNILARTMRIVPFAEHAFGLSPLAIAAAPDGTRIFVALAGVNAVAVIRVSDGRVEGLIPTAWYPATLALSRDGKRLAICCLMGVGSGGDAHVMLPYYNPEYIQDHPAPLRADQNLRYVHDYRGSVQLLDVPDEALLASYSRIVAANDRLHLAGGARTVAAAANVRALPVPHRAGEPSLIDHVVYIVKENRAYDQLFGDLSRGNNDRTLVMYGKDVTPNHHRLAEDFVVLDNTFATGGSSGDGHQWVTQANATPYVFWPGYGSRSYPRDGTDPMAYSSTGFIWEDALRAHRTVRIFGEFSGDMQTTLADRIPMLRKWQRGEDFTKTFHSVAPIASVNPVLATDFPTCCSQVPDVVRAEIFLNDLAGWQQSGMMPNLVIMQLPADHTGGLLPGYSSPKAAMGDNDLALGRIVEGLTHSRFWRSMAIFVVEDDAQGALDHVDGHRIPALAISPYTKRGSTDSTMYGTPSFLKTMELMLGMQPMTIFDLTMNDMRRSFTTTPDYRPYVAVKPIHSLLDINPKPSALTGPAREAALASMRMRWDIPDAIDSDVVNKMLWHDAKGWQVAYPEWRRGTAAVAARDDDESR